MKLGSSEFKCLGKVIEKEPNSPQVWVQLTSRLCCFFKTIPLLARVWNSLFSFLKECD